MTTPNLAKRFAPNRLPSYSKSEIIKEIRRVVLDECGGQVPDRDRFDRLARVSHTTIAKRFGTYEEGFRRAGFTIRRVITADQVKANLLEVMHRANGCCFTENFYLKNGGAYCVDVVKDRLGVQNWRGVFEVIGAREQPRIRHTVVSAHAQRRNLLAHLTEAELFREIDRVWQAKGGRPTHDEFKRLSRFGIKVYKSRFGSWTKAVESFCSAMGISVQWHSAFSGAGVTKDVLLAELRAAQLKRPRAILTYAYFRANGGTYSKGVFIANFGGWTTAVNAAGGISGEQARYSRDDLFDEIQRLWEQCGRQPTQVQMLNEGNISPKCYAKMFGGWTKAIHAFCDDRNDPVSTAIEESPKQNRHVIEPPAAEAPVDIPSKETAPLFVEHRTGRTVSPKLRFRVFMRDEFTCRTCGRSRSNHPDLEIEADHIVAYSNGGETEFNNLQTLCKECNRGKSNL